MTVAANVAEPAQELRQTGETTQGTGTYRPNVDILETPDHLTIRVDLPGTSGENIDVDFREKTLTIHARVPRRQPEGTKFLLNEYGVGDFHRAFTVGESIDASKIAAEFRNGMLTLHLPKVNAVKPHKIAVNVT